MKKNRPQIRFDGFTDDWEQRKLGEVGEIITGSTPKTTDKRNYGGDYLFVSPIDIQENRYVSDTITKLTKKGFESGRKITKNSILFVSIGSTIGKVGQATKDLVTNQQINSVLINKENDSDFLYASLVKESGKIKSLAATQAVPIINKTSFSNTILSFPGFEEQQKIGTFFQQLDDTIALHQEKLESLKNMKKSYLQKMFPKGNEIVPEIRFDGFTDAWEQRKLGDITESYSGGTPRVGNKMYYGGNIPFIRSGEINDDKTELFITEEGLNNSSAKMVSKGDILYALYGATSGEVSISKINGAINQAILAIKPKEDDDSYLITQWLKKQKESIIVTYLQGGQGNLSGGIIKNLNLWLPIEKNEQKKIGTFFKELDDTIALHQHKLDKLKNIKKAMLQRMFV